MSFALTMPQILSMTKTVTRRTGWAFLNDPSADDLLVTRIAFEYVAVRGADRVTQKAAR